MFSFSKMLIYKFCRVGDAVKLNELLLRVNIRSASRMLKLRLILCLRIGRCGCEFRHYYPWFLVHVISSRFVSFAPPFSIVQLKLSQ